MRLVAPSAALIGAAEVTFALRALTSPALPLYAQVLLLGGGGPRALTTRAEAQVW